MSQYRWKSDSLELPDGRVIHAEAEVHYIPATYWDPPESDVGDADWYIDGAQVEQEVMDSLASEHDLDLEALLESEGTQIDSVSFDDGPFDL